MKTNLHQLKVLAAVAELGSMTQAAKKLYMTQPAVSIQIKQLEEQYRMVLTEVIGKKVYLTEAGKKIYSAYQKITKSLNWLEMELANLKGNLAGQLSISMVSTAKYFIADLLGPFHRQFPQIEIQLKVLNRGDVLHRLEQNCDDLYILSQLPEKQAIIAKPILKDCMVIPAPLDHPLVHQKKIHLNELANYPFVIRESGSGTRMVMERVMTNMPEKPRIVMELGSNSAIKQAIMAGFGLSMVSQMSITHELELNKLVILDIKKFPIPHNWYLVYLKGKELSLVAKNFFEMHLEKINEDKK